MLRDRPPRCRQAAARVEGLVPRPTVQTSELVIKLLALFLVHYASSKKSVGNIVVGKSS